MTEYGKKIVGVVVMIAVTILLSAVIAALVFGM